MEKLKQRWLIKLLYKPINEVNVFSLEQLNKVIEEYLVLGRVYDMGKDFREILFSKKPEELLEKWIKECELLEIEEITSCKNGIQ